MQTLHRITKQIEGLASDIQKATKGLTVEINTAASDQMDAIITQIKGLKQLGEAAISMKTLAESFSGAPASEVAPKVRRTRRPNGYRNLQTTEAAAPKVRRTRKPKEITLISEPKEPYTSGPEYEPHLMQAFKELGGRGKLYEAQKKMRDLMAAQGLLKPGDEKHTGATPRKRYVALTGVRRQHLVADGFLSMDGEEYVITEKGLELAKSGHQTTARRGRKVAIAA